MHRTLLALPLTCVALLGCDGAPPPPAAPQPSGSAPPAMSFGAGVGGLCGTLTGPLREVLDRESVRSLELGTDAWEWREDAADEHPIVARPIYQDVDHDGFADAHIAVYDGAVAHWLFAYATGPRAWGPPQYVGRMTYNDFWSDRTAFGALHAPDRFYHPQSTVVGGRTLVAFAVGPANHFSTESSDILYELVGGELVEVMRHTGRASTCWSVRRWSAGAREDGSIFLSTYQSGPGGARGGFKCWVLDAGSDTANTVECPPEDVYYAMFNEYIVTHPTHDHLIESHPQRIAASLTGIGNDVLRAPIWQHLGIDPSAIDLYARDTPPSDEPPHRWHWWIESAPAYEDFDEDGLPDAYVVITQGWTTWWVVFKQSAPGDWVPLGFLGPYSVENGWTLAHNFPNLPRIVRVGGRTLLETVHGHAGDLSSSTRFRIDLVEGDALHPLLDDELSAHGFDGAFDTKVTYEIADDGAVLIRVRRFDAFIADDDAVPVETRVHRLAPGAITLDP